MNAHVAPPAESAPIDPLAILRQPFPANQVSKLPKESKTQSDERKTDRTKGISCQICGGWHHRNAVHLDYVGHAALTDRLLDVDPHWSWEPVAFRDGLPAFDATGGLWIKLTVCGVTRLGYGHAAAKPQMDPGAREKEVIGDALRNAAMRFGAALDLWHKGDLHAHVEAEAAEDDKPSSAALMGAMRAAIDIAETLAELDAWKVNNAPFLEELSASDLYAYNAIVAHWKARAKAVKARTPASAKAAFPDDFGRVTDEDAATLNGARQ